MTIAFLLLAAFSAGILDGIAGGGGLIQLPALLASMPHKETVEILGTSKVAATMGTSAFAVALTRFGQHLVIIVYSVDYQGI